MLSKDPNFRRVKKLGGRGAFGRSYYWLGKDHLLLVEISGYSEKYRRFYFRDIQAVVLEQNNRQLVINLIGVAIVGLLGIMVLAWLEEDWAAAITPLVLAIAGIVMLVRNNVLGRGATVSLRTAVQTVQLPGITRWKRGELLAGELTPLVLAAQPLTAVVSAEAPAPEPVSAPPAERSTEPPPAAT
jgi:hypothetical protein